MAFTHRFSHLKWGSSLLDATKDFFSRTAVNGMKHVVEADRVVLERSLWVAVQTVAFSTAFYLVLSTWSDFTSNPTVTTLDNQNYPVSKLPFPAVALCNANRLSRRAVMAYAIELHEKAKKKSIQQSVNITEKTVDYYFEMLRYLGRLIDNEIEGSEDFLAFQDLLDGIESDNYGFSTLDVEEVMKRLTPTCSDLLLICRFQFRQRNCSDLFDLRKTFLGQCCMFNSIRASKLNNYTRTKAYYPKKVGEDSGLTVVINTTMDDFYYQAYSSAGVFLMLFHPVEYPDLAVGNTRYEIIDPNTENFIRLSIFANIADPEVKNYAVEKVSVF